MSFSPAALQAVLPTLCDATRLRVAFSGGLDSTVLLHALCELQRAKVISAALTAIHVHHGLSPEAGAWARHCAVVCNHLGVPLVERRVTVDTAGGEGVEGAARRARYAVFEQEIQAGDCLLTAHHADDQAETLLLQLMRGSGPHGLAAMPKSRPFGRGKLVRPLLPFRRDALEAWAVKQGLDWMDDHSNQRQVYDRNFLRLTVLPQLRARWPGLLETLTRTAQLCGESAFLMDELAAIDCQSALTENPRQLRWPDLAHLSEIRRRNLLHYWIKLCNLPLPNANRLTEMGRVFWEAEADRSPSVRWGGLEMRRYRDRLCLVAAATPFDSSRRLTWKLSEPLLIDGAGRLSAHPTMGRGILLDKLATGVAEVRFRTGGEHCRPAGRAGSHALKKLFQELGVPPWLRERTPLIYRGDELIALADRVVCEGYLASADELGWVFEWEPEDD